MLSAEPPVFRRPTYSATHFVGVPAAVITLGASINCMAPSLRIGILSRLPEDTPHRPWWFRQWPDCDGTTDRSTRREAAVAPRLRSMQTRASLAHSSRGRTRLHPAAKTDN